MTRFVTSLLPHSLHSHLRGMHHRRLIAKGRFRSPEPEWDRLAEWIRPGDTVLDIGANVGHYTCRFSELVGPTGRVVAFEPVMATFAALAQNVKVLRNPNITLINAAVGAAVGYMGLTVPERADGSYLAHLDPNSARKCLVLSGDALGLPAGIRFIKIDAEGHEPHVLAGLKALIQHNRPVVMLERNIEGQALLEQWGYTLTTSPTRTPNIVALPD